MHAIVTLPNTMHTYHVIGFTVCTNKLLLSLLPLTYHGPIGVGNVLAVEPGQPPSCHRRSVSITAHLSNCPQVSKGTDPHLAIAGSPGLVRVPKPHQGGMKGTNICLSKVAAQFREPCDLQQQSNHVLCRFERDRITSHNVAYTCATCLQIWKWAPYLCVDIEAGLRCKKAEGRSENLRSGSTRQFFRKGSAALQRDLCKVRKVSAIEKKSFS